MIRFHLHLLALGMALWTTPAARAQQQLDSVVVTASRLELQANQMGQRVLVLRGEAIHKWPVTSLDDLLRYLPGVEVQSRGLFGTQADITLRGSTFNQVLVLIDGVRVNDPLTGHFTSYMPVTMAEIERIEIAYGASSALYGTEAVGGVIHIITKVFAQASARGTDGQVRMQYGQYQTLTFEGGFSHAGKEWRLVVGAQHAQSDGHLPKGDSLPYDFTRSTVAAGLARQLGPRMHLSMRSAWDLRNFNARFFYTRSPYDRSRERVQRGFHQASLRWQQNPSSETRLIAGYQTTTDSFAFHPAFPANRHVTRQLDLKAWHRFQLGRALRFGLGGQYLGKRIESNDRGNHRASQWGLFASIHFQPSGKIDLQGSLRLESEASFGTEVVPQLSLSWRVKPSLRMRAFAGRSIRAADFTERYISTNLSSLSPGRNLGNPALQAERAWNFELGADAVLSGRLSAHLSLYHRAGSNLIDFVLTEGTAIPDAPHIDPGGTYFFAQNIARLGTSGAELELRYRATFDAGELEAVAAYRRLAFASRGEVLSKYIANSAGHLWSFQGRWTGRCFSLSANGLYKRRTAEAAPAIGRSLPASYAVWNLHAQLHPFQLPLALTGTLLNAFDATYADVLGADMPGRWWLAGLRYAF